MKRRNIKVCKSRSEFKTSIERLTLKYLKLHCQKYICVFTTVHVIVVSEFTETYGDSINLAGHYTST